MTEIKIIEVNDEINDRIVLSFCNFDYYDGIDLIAKIISKKFDDSIVQRLDNVSGRLLVMQSEKYQYVLSYDETYGNDVYSLNKSFHNDLKGKLRIVIDELNTKFNL